MEKLMEFWLDEEKGQGILLPESQGKQLGLKPTPLPPSPAELDASSKEGVVTETKEILPEENKAVSTPPPPSPAELDASSKEGVVSKPRAKGKK